MHIADVKIPSTWTQFSTYTDVENGATYVLVNSSPDILYFVESDGEPRDTVIGVPIDNGEFVNYQKGSQDLYIRNGAPSTSTKVSNLTINKVG